MARYSSHSSDSVTPGRFSSWWIAGQSGGGRTGLGPVSAAGNRRCSSASSPKPSGSGQPKPARFARSKYSRAAVRPSPRHSEIWRFDSPAACSGNASLILRIGNLFIGPRLPQKGATVARQKITQRCPFAPVHKVAGCPGIGGRTETEQVAGSNRNHWPDGPGMGTRHCRASCRCGGLPWSALRSWR